MYLIVIIITSFIITFIITGIFSPIFKSEHPNCKNIDFEIVSKKKDDSGIKLIIKNNGNSKFSLAFNDEERLKPEITPKETQEVIYKTKEKEVTVTPLYIDISGGVYYCKGKREVLDLNRMI